MRDPLGAGAGGARVPVRPTATAEGRLRYEGGTDVVVTDDLHEDGSPISEDLDLIATRALGGLAEGRRVRVTVEILD